MAFYLADQTAKASSLLAEAEEHGNRYECKEASECYDKLLRGSLRSPEAVKIAFRSADNHELAGYQSGEAKSYRAELEAARSIYLRLEQEFEKDSSSLTFRIAKVKRIQLESRFVFEGRERRRMLDEALAISRTVLIDSELQQGRIPLRLGNNHIWLLGDRGTVDDGESAAALLTESLALGAKMVASCGECDVDELGETYANYLYATWAAARYFDEWAKDPDRRIAILEKAISILPRVRSKFVSFLLNITIHGSTSFLKGQDKAVEYGAAALAAARVTRVLPAIYGALGGIRWVTLWNMLAERDGEQAELRFQEIVSSFEETKENMQHMSPDMWALGNILHSYQITVHAHFEYAKHFVTDMDLRRQLAERGVELFREGWPLAELTELHPGIWLAQMGPEALRFLASLETDRSRSQELLTEAISIAQKARVLISKREPLATPWYTGELIIQEGMIRYDLAQKTGERSKKQEMLQAAVDQFRQGLETAISGMHEFPKGTYTPLGGYLLTLARALSELFELTNDPQLNKEQLDTLDRAVDAYSKAERPSRVAEVLWQKAKILSRSGQHSEASLGFRGSSEAYEKAALATPSLRGLYSDLSQFMIGWSQIEEARASHGVGLYKDASRTYQNAAATLRATQRWSPLSDLYAASAVLEKAEDASYEEKSESAIQLFSEAAGGFSALQGMNSSWNSEILGDGGDEEVLGWERVAVGRERYCRARVEVEDAKLLYQKGEHGPSARRFAVAKTIFQGLAEGVEREEKQELATLALICAAWQTMEEAEALTSSERYAEAARIFERAADSATSEKIAMLVQGHAAYCEALKLGSELRARRDPALYRQTKELLEVAVDSYTRAGVSRGALWARGTERVLDGLIYLGQAESELVAKAKAELYTLSERSFEAAGKLYEEASFSSKRAQADQYLQVAREQRRIFASPADALDASFVLRSPQVEVAPKLTRDQPVGVERFEAANVQGNLVAARTEVAVGETVDFTLQLVSAGRSPAILVKLTEIESPGLEVEIEGGKYRVEEGAVNFKGHRLQPFETLDIRLRIKPTRAGELVFQPSVLYLDELGQYRRYQAARGTLRVVSSDGTQKATPSPERGPDEIQFKSPAAKTVFDSLVSAFIEDYMVKKLYLDQAGWRSLTKISEASKIPHASLYGKQGRYGPALDELFSRGMAEARVFTGHRGRGGEVIKVRIFYGKEPVKRYLDNHVMKPRNE